MAVLASMVRGEETIPYLSFQDLKALAPSGVILNCDFSYPIVKSVPDQVKLVAECQRDYSEYFRLRFKKKHADIKSIQNLTGNLYLRAIHQGQKNKLLYFVFEVETKAINDLMVVYYYSPELHKFILKSQV